MNIKETFIDSNKSFQNLNEYLDYVFVSYHDNKHIGLLLLQNKEISLFQNSKNISGYSLPLAAFRSDTDLLKKIFETSNTLYFPHQCDTLIQNKSLFESHFFNHHEPIATISKSTNFYALNNIYPNFTHFFLPNFGNQLLTKIITLASCSLFNNNDDFVESFSSSLNPQTKNSSVYSNILNIFNTLIDSSLLDPNDSKLFNKYFLTSFVKKLAINTSLKSVDLRTTQFLKLITKLSDDLQLSVFTLLSNKINSKEAIAIPHLIDLPDFPEKYKYLFKDLIQNNTFDSKINQLKSLNILKQELKNKQIDKIEQTIDSEHIFKYYTSLYTKTNFPFNDDFNISSNFSGINIHASIKKILHFNEKIFKINFTVSGNDKYSDEYKNLLIYLNNNSIDFFDQILLSNYHHKMTTGNSDFLSFNYKSEHFEIFNKFLSQHRVNNLTDNIQTKIISGKKAKI